MATMATRMAADPKALIECQVTSSADVTARERERVKCRQESECDGRRG